MCAIYRWVSDDEKDKAEMVGGGMGVRISLPNYKMMYEVGQEEVMVRRRSGGESAMLGARAAARQEEGRRRVLRLW